MSSAAVVIGALRVKEELLWTFNNKFVGQQNGA